MDKAESTKIAGLLLKAEQLMGTLEGGRAAPEDVLPKVVKLIQQFRATSHELGSKGLVQVGGHLERFAKNPSLGPEDLTTLTFALGFLRGGVSGGTSEGLRSAMIETLELLGVEPFDVSIPFDADEKPRAKKKAEASWMPNEHLAKQPKEVKEAEKPKAEDVVKPAEKVEAVEPPKPVELKVEPVPVAVEKEEDIDLDVIASRLGGKLIMPAEGSDEPVRLEIPPESMEMVKLLLSPFDPGASLAERLPSADDRLKEVIDSVKEFMASFAEGNLERAQEVLEELAEFQGEGELFTEIGGIARGLHDSLSNFASTLDPELKDFVEEKIPDSGNRLEHILKLTEDAANTTLNHAEFIQGRYRNDQERLVSLKRHLDMLMPIGEGACERMDESALIIRELEESIHSSQKDLGTILTSQGYQDLTGQIIGKIVSFQKDLEGKLVGLVRTFGVKVTKSKDKKDSELYGPAHEKKGGALHSQDEVDDILAQFGF